MSNRDCEFLDLMARRDFRNFVWQMLQEARVFDPVTVGSSYTLMNEGKRQMGLWVLEKINRICPDRYIEMAKENRPETKP